nr:MAG TPA_asm: hypothetical protein [Bacteriophage sp.]
MQSNIIMLFLFSFKGVTYAEGSSFLNVFSEESLTG